MCFYIQEGEHLEGLSSFERSSSRTRTREIFVGTERPIHAEAQPVSKQQRQVGTTGEHAWWYSDPNWFREWLQLKAD